MNGRGLFQAKELLQGDAALEQRAALPGAGQGSRRERQEPRGESGLRAFKVAHAAAEDWAHAAQACADALDDCRGITNLGFLYITDHLAEEVGSILAYLRQRTGIAHWAGSVGSAICAGSTEYADRPALAVMVTKLPESAFCVFPAFSQHPEQLAAEHRTWIAETSPGFGIVHGDPNNPRTPQLLAELVEWTSGFLVGGLTSSRGPCIQIADRVTGGGLSGVLFAPSVAVQIGLAQGCSPIGPSHLISDCVDNVVIGLDGRRALEVLREDAGGWLEGDLERTGAAIQVALPVPGSDTGDYLVRNLIAIDATHGWLAIGERVAPGERLVFVQRDPGAARVNLAAMLAKLNKRLAGPARGGVYFSCTGRGEALFGEPGGEIAAVREVFGDLPLVGFSCAGEICNGRLYGYTGVLALFT